MRRARESESEKERAEAAEREREGGAQENLELGLCPFFVSASSLIPICHCDLSELKTEAKKIAANEFILVFGKHRAGRSSRHEDRT